MSRVRSPGVLAAGPAGFTMGVPLWWNEGRSRRWSIWTARSSCPLGSDVRRTGGRLRAPVYPPEVSFSKSRSLGAVSLLLVKAGRMWACPQVTALLKLLTGKCASPRGRTQPQHVLCGCVWLSTGKGQGNTDTCCPPGTGGAFGSLRPDMSHVCQHSQVQENWPRTTL